MTTVAPLITIDDVRGAAAAIADHVADTPFLHSETLSEIAGCELWLKFENLQFTGIFKQRGALNKLLSLSSECSRSCPISTRWWSRSVAVA